MGLRSKGRRARRDGGTARVSLGAALTGLMVALASTLAFATLAGRVLQWQGHDLNLVVRGDTYWASAGAGTAFILAVLLSFLWGGYTAGRMAAGAGAKNGALVPVITLLALAIYGAVTVGLRNLDRVELPFGVGSVPLDANFTPLGIVVVAGTAVALLAGGIWGGIIGARWHLRLTADDLLDGYQSTTTDSFSDLTGQRPL